MKRLGPLLGLALLAAVLVAGLTVLFRLRLSHGDVFPEYSSLRSDPLGTRVLHDSLSELRGLRVDRRFAPLRTLEPNPPRTIILAGLSPRSLDLVTREQFDALDAAIKSGSRLVLAFRSKAAGREDEDDDGEPATNPSSASRKSANKEPTEKAGPEKKSAEKSSAKKKRGDSPESDDEWSGRPPLNYVDLQKRWGIDVTERFLVERAGSAALRDRANAPGGLPDQVAWHSDVYFKPAADGGWRTIYRRATEPVLVEKSLERGSIVLAADAYFLSNEALQRDRAAPLLVWVVGTNRRIVFDEAHLGVVADPGVAALARRYGLSGAFFTLVVLAALYVWRRMAMFVPPPPETGDVTLSYHPAAGLEALLRRAVPADKIVEACATEWAPTARPSDRRRLEAALANSPKASVVDRYNAVVRALKRRDSVIPPVIAPNEPAPEAQRTAGLK